MRAVNWFNCFRLVFELHREKHGTLKRRYVTTKCSMQNDSSLQLASASVP